MAALNLLRILQMLFVVLTAVLILLVLLFLCMRIGIEAVGVRPDVSVVFRCGLLKIPIWPMKKKIRQSAPVQKKKAVEKKKKAYELPSIEWWQLFLQTLESILDEMTGRLCFSQLHLRFIVATDDAATTGMLYGAMGAAAATLLPVMENTFSMKEYHVRVDVDFDDTEMQYAFSIACAFRPIWVLLALLKHHKELYQLFRIFGKKRRVNHERESNQQFNERNDGKN